MKRWIVSFLVAALLILLSGCSNKTALTKEEFTAMMEESGFTVEDVTESTGMDVQSVSQANYIGTDGLILIQVLFIIEKDARDISVSIPQIVKIADMYSYSYAIKNTSILITGPLDQEEAMKQLARKLGY